MYHLAMFFRPGRNVKGGFFSPTENVVNAVERNLSLLSESELLSLREAARNFIDTVNDTLAERYSA